MVACQRGGGGWGGGPGGAALPRRYHGLLVAPVDPPLGRRLVFAKADATLVADGREWPLFTNRWGGGTVAPAGYLDLESFTLDQTTPVWIFAAGGHLVEARIWLEHGANTVHCAWKLLSEATGPVSLRVTLLVNGRDHHGTTDRNGFCPAVTAEAPERSKVGQPGGFTLTIQAIGGRIEPQRDWYADFALPVEEERGLPAIDHHLCLGE